MLLKALEEGVYNLHLCFADTGNEHPDTYSYVRYLDEIVASWGGQSHHLGAGRFVRENAQKARLHRRELADHVDPGQAG